MMFMKKFFSILSILISSVILITSLLPLTTAAEDATNNAETTDIVTYGDVNIDGRVSLTDLVLIKKYCAGIVSFNNQQLVNSDCNTDGIVNSADSAILFRYFVLMIDTLPYNTTEYPVANPEVIDEFTPCKATIEDTFDDWHISITIKCQYSDPARIWTVKDFEGVENISSINQYSSESPYRTFLEVGTNEDSKENIIKLIHDIEALELVEIKQIETLLSGLGDIDDNDM